MHACIPMFLPQLNTLLFVRLHGTSLESARFIAQHGFDERQASLQGLYGAGNYFAVQSCKSHHYSKKHIKGSTTHVVLLCRVVMGWPYCTKKLHKNARKPPDNPETPGRPFDSIFAEDIKVDGQKNVHHEYIVFSSSQVGQLCMYVYVHVCMYSIYTCHVHPHAVVLRKPECTCVYVACIPSISVCSCYKKRASRITLCWICFYTVTYTEHA